MLKNICISGACVLLIVLLSLGAGCTDSTEPVNPDGVNSIVFKDGNFEYEYNDRERFMLSVKILSELANSYDAMKARHKKWAREVSSGTRQGDGSFYDRMMDDNQGLHSTVLWINDYLIYDILVNPDDEKVIDDAFSALLSAHGSLRMLYMDRFSDLTMDNHSNAQEAALMSIKNAFEHGRLQGYIE